MQPHAVEPTKVQEPETLVVGTAEVVRRPGEDLGALSRRQSFAGWVEEEDDEGGSAARARGPLQQMRERHSAAVLQRGACIFGHIPYVGTFLTW